MSETDWQNEAEQRLALAREGQPEQADLLFSETRQRLAQLLAEERALASEVLYYRQRIDELRRAIKSGGVGEEDQAQLVELEKGSDRERASLAALRRRLQELTRAIDGSEERWQKTAQGIRDAHEKNQTAVQREIEREQQLRLNLAAEHDREINRLRAQLAHYEKELRARGKL